MMRGCCQEHRELVTAPCGRRFTVCTNCDNGINACTEGECDHLNDVDQCPGPYCEYGRPGYRTVCYTHDSYEGDTA